MSLSGDFDRIKDNVEHNRYKSGISVNGYKIEDDISYLVVGIFISTELIDALVEYAHGKRNAFDDNVKEFFDMNNIPYERN